MRFAEPMFLWLLLPVLPGLALFFWWAARKRESLLRRFVHARLLPNLVAGISPARRRLREALIVISAALLIIALARPQWGFSWQEVTQRGLDIVIAIDTSRSMLAQDITPDRLTRAKLAALDLMQIARTDRLGLVAFAGSAFLQCPLTIDDAAFRQSVELLDTKIIQQGGTALAEAIRAAATAYKEGDNHRILVILTDGEDHDPGAVNAAAEAAEAGMRIFTVGVGKPEGEVLQIRDEKGQTDYVRDEKGDVVKSRLNEALLREVATAGKGFYLAMSGAGTMDTLYEKGLATLPKNESSEKLIQRYHEQYHWPLGIAMLLLAVEILLQERRRTAIAAGPLAACLLLVAGTTQSMASPGSAQRDYQDGKYEDALREYKQLIQQDKKSDPRLPFNAGAAAYRGGQFNEAARLFDQAAKAPDLELQEKAYYNRGNALFQSGDQEANPQVRQQKWEQALKDFSASLKLNPQDPDSRHNYDYVKQRLEELKQQQQQQNQSQDDQQKQDQQNQQGQDQQQPQDQQQQQQEQEGQQNSQQQQTQDQQQAGQEPQQQDQQQSNSQPEQKDREQQERQQQKEQTQPAEAPEQKPEQQGQPIPSAPDEMTPEQAARFLDGQEEETKLMPLQQRPAGERKVLRDW